MKAVLIALLAGTTCCHAQLSFETAQEDDQIGRRMSDAKADASTLPRIKTDVIVIRGSKQEALAKLAAIYAADEIARKNQEEADQRAREAQQKVELEKVNAALTKRYPDLNDPTSRLSTAVTKVRDALNASDSPLLNQSEVYQVWAIANLAVAKLRSEDQSRDEFGSADGKTESDFSALAAKIYPDSEVQGSALHNDILDSESRIHLKSAFQDYALVLANFSANRLAIAPK